MNNKKVYFLCLCLIILLFCLFHKYQNYETFKKNNKNNKKVNISILLTTTFVPHNIKYIYQKDVKNRKNTYIKSLKKWLKNTNLKIVMIDNSVINNVKDIELMQNKRFELIKYPMDSEIEMSKGFLESKSILEAIKRSKLMKNSTHIVKVTGRYFVPNLEKELNKITINTDYIHQNKKNYCEIFGFKKELAQNILNDVPKQVHLEDYLEKKRKKFKNLHKLPILPIQKTQMGGRNEIRHFL